MPVANREERIGLQRYLYHDSLWRGPGIPAIICGANTAVVRHGAGLCDAAACGTDICC